MKALVVYDSVFGNTEKIARAIGSALGSLEDVGVMQVGEAGLEHLKGLSVLVVGSPTRAFNPTKAITSFLKSLPPGALSGVAVAGFDTRMNIDEAPGFLKFMVKFFGYAAEPIAKRLKRAGGKEVAAPAGFIVADTEGPLKDGELERAAVWAKQILETSGVD